MLQLVQSLLFHHYTKKSLKTGTPFGLIIMGSTPPTPPSPPRPKKKKRGGKHRAWRNFILVMKFLLQVARRERIKDAVIIKEEVRQCTWAKKSSEVWEGERARFVCFGLIFAWQSLSPPISRLWAAQPVKKYTRPPPPSLLVHGKGRTIWILSWRGVRE